MKISESMNAHQPPMQKIKSGAIGSFFTILVCTPLDVIKNTMQFHSEKRFVESMANQKAVALDGYRGGLGGMLRVVQDLTRTKGIRSLWRGVGPSIANQVPSTAAYYAVYDSLKDFFRDRKLLSNVYMGSFVSAILARSIVTSVFTPLELTRTLIQVGSAEKPYDHLFRTCREKGILSLWRGMGISLVRDVPFSALYWFSYEYIKDALVHQDHVDGNRVPVYINFISGATSASATAAITTPIDVIKTRLQGSHDNRTLWSVIQQVHSQNAWFNGIVPRVLRITPGCAIMISTYQFLNKPHDEL